MWTVIKSLLATAWGFVIYWIKGQGSNESALESRDAEIAQLRDQVARLETAAASERTERLKKVDEKAAAVRDSAGAAELLREVTGADAPNTTK